MAAVDSIYWNKCIDKVMKEAEQYLIYDGIVASPDDTSSENLDVDIPSQVSLSGCESAENDVILTSNVSEMTTSIPKTKLKSVDIKKRRRKIPGGLRFRNLVVKECTKDLISPAKLSSKHGISIRTIQYWVTSSGAKMPKKYKKELLKVFIPTNNQPLSSQSNSATTFGDHSYTRTDFNLSPTINDIKEIIASEKPSTSTAAQQVDPCTTKTFKCSMCVFETLRRSCFVSHIRSHGPSASHTSCKQCGEVFPDKRQLAKHLTSHKREKNKLCEFCSREFKDLSNKRRHMKICKKRPE